MSKCRSILVAVTGASGIVYAERLINVLHSYGDISLTGVILSKSSKKVAEYELGRSLELPNNIKLYDELDFSAPFASSSNLPDCMVVIPASMNTIGKIAHGLQDNLITRSSLSMLRVRRKLILVPRETPLGTVELENLLKISRNGGIILPACPGFYHQPKTIDDLINFVVGKILDLLEIRHSLYSKWGEN